MTPERLAEIKAVMRRAAEDTNPHDLTPLYAEADELLDEVERLQDRALHMGFDFALDQDEIAKLKAENEQLRKDNEERRKYGGLTVAEYKSAFEAKALS